MSDKREIKIELDTWSLWYVYFSALMLVIALQHVANQIGFALCLTNGDVKLCADVYDKDGDDLDRNLDD